MYKNGQDQNYMVEYTEAKIAELRTDYLSAKENEDQEAIEQIVAEGKKWRNALEVMKKVIRVKAEKNGYQLEKDAEEIFK